MNILLYYIYKYIYVFVDFFFSRSFMSVSNLLFLLCLLRVSLKQSWLINQRGGPLSLYIYKYIYMIEVVAGPHALSKHSLFPFLSYTYSQSVSELYNRDSECLVRRVEQFRLDFETIER